MDSLKLADFLCTRVSTTIEAKQYIKEVNIDYDRQESYGNDYINVTYQLKLDKNFDELPLIQQNDMFKGSPSYTFSLSTHTAWGHEVKKRVLLRLIEFRHIYESLTAYVVLQLEKHLNPGTSIKVKGIDLWTEANYAERYLHTALKESYIEIMHSTHTEDVRQWQILHELAIKSKQTYLKNKNSFNITDSQIYQLSGIDIGSIRSLLIRYQVPIKFKGYETIDEIYINAFQFVAALKQDLATSDYVARYKQFSYQRLINQLYTHYLPDQKNEVIRLQQSEFLKHFMIQKGDILELNDTRIVMVDSLSIDHQNAIHIQYIILKNNLQLSTRTRIIKSEQVAFVLKQEEFSVYLLHNTPVKHLSLLKKWMLKRKIKLSNTIFEPDLFRL